MYSDIAGTHYAWMQYAGHTFTNPSGNIGMTTIIGSPVSTNLYSTVATLKTRLGITDTTDDTTLGLVLTGVCRAIDTHCGQSFCRDAVATTRYYTCLWDDDTLFIDPIVSVTSLATDTAYDRTYATVWAVTDYDLMPYNAAANDHPYTWIETAPNGNYDFLSLARRQDHRHFRLAGRASGCGRGGAVVERTYLQAQGRAVRDRVIS